MLLSLQMKEIERIINKEYLNSINIRQLMWEPIVNKKTYVYDKKERKITNVFKRCGSF